MLYRIHNIHIQEGLNHINDINGTASSIILNHTDLDTCEVVFCNAIKEDYTVCNTFLWVYELI